MSAVRKTDYLEGLYLDSEGSLNVESPKVMVKGKNGSISLDDELMSKHVLCVGGTGTGKSNGLVQIIREIKNNMSENDVMVVFDTKGDYYSDLYDEKLDYVISNDGKSSSKGQKDYWNIFKEIDIDGEKHWEENILEICNTLFQEKVENSQNPFFPKAGRDIFSGILRYLMEECRERDNRLLYNNFFITPAELKEKFDTCKAIQYLKYYIQNTESQQTQGVISEFQQVAREIMMGNFRRKGNMSMREIVRNKGRSTVFIEYDLAIGKVLTPIYQVLFDLAIKESLSRKKSEGNVYFIIDEFMLLPHLYHLENGVNFGRSFGAKFIIAMQNIDQIRANYGHEIGNSILSSFDTKILFRVSDGPTRDYVKGMFGTNRKRLIIDPVNRNDRLREEVVVSDVIEDWVISGLGLGEAIISSGNNRPFLFQFNKA